jgi:PAS domain-containing protein
MKPFTDTDLISGIQAGLSRHNAGNKIHEKFPVGDPETIMNSSDTAIVTDILGRVIFFNPSALVFLDLTPKQLLMNSFKNVARIINDQTGEPFGDLVHEVVTQKLVVTHELNTELVTRSGKHNKISITARPVMDDRNDLMGVCLSIREKSG